jgi:hypothetical protein
LNLLRTKIDIKSRLVSCTIKPKAIKGGDSAENPDSRELEDESQCLTG